MRRPSCTSFLVDLFMNLPLEQVQDHAKPSLQEQSRLLELLTTLPTPVRMAPVFSYPRFSSEGFRQKDLLAKDLKRPNLVPCGK